MPCNKFGTSGGTPDTVYLTSSQLQRALGFTGNNNERATAQNGKVSQLLSIYMTPWGSVTFTPSRHQESQKCVHITEQYVGTRFITSNEE